MRLHLGAPPVDQEFQPEVDGWTPMKEPTPLMLNLIATPAAFIAGGILIAGWMTVRPKIELGGSSNAALTGAAVVVGLVVLVVVHELLHAFAYPKFGFTKDVLIGIWPSKLLCYAASLGVVGRSRLLVVYLMPLLVLSVLPLLVCLVLRLRSAEAGIFAVVSVVNGMLAGGDLTIIGLILWQVPSNAVLKNKGWATWWKPIE